MTTHKPKKELLVFHILHIACVIYYLIHFYSFWLRKFVKLITAGRVKQQEASACARPRGIRLWCTLQLIRTSHPAKNIHTLKSFRKFVAYLSLKKRVPKCFLWCSANNLCQEWRGFCLKLLMHPNPKWHAASSEKADLWTTCSTVDRKHIVISVHPVKPGNTAKKLFPPATYRTF